MAILAIDQHPHAHYTNKHMHTKLGLVLGYRIAPIHNMTLELNF